MSHYLTKLKEQNSEYNVPVQNKLDILNNEVEKASNMDFTEDTQETTSDNQTNSAQSAQTPARKVKIPPIVLTFQIGNYTRLIDDLKKHVKCAPKTSHSSSGLKVFLDNMSDHKALVAELIKQNLPFYTHPLKGQKPVNQVMKGLP